MRITQVSNKYIKGMYILGMKLEQIIFRAFILMSK